MKNTRILTLLSLAHLMLNSACPSSDDDSPAASLAPARELLCDGLARRLAAPKAFDAWIESRRSQFDAQFVQCIDVLIPRKAKAADDRDDTCRRIADADAARECGNYNPAATQLLFLTAMRDVSVTGAQWRMTPDGMLTLGAIAICESQYTQEFCAAAVTGNYSEPQIRSAVCPLVDCTH
jgi:hypothetical protein